MDIKKELQKVNDRINLIVKMIDKMIGAVETPEKETPKTPKIKSVKEADVKPVAKKPVKLTASDTVLGIIKKYKNGIDTTPYSWTKRFKALRPYNKGEVKCL